MDPVEELHKLDGVNCRKAIAGGIKLETFEDAVNSPADVIICGGGIYNLSLIHILLPAGSEGRPSISFFKKSSSPSAPSKSSLESPPNSPS